MMEDKNISSMKSSATFTRTNKSLKSYSRLNRLRKRKRVYDITLSESECKEYQEWFEGNYLDILRYNYFGGIAFGRIHQKDECQNFVCSLKTGD